MNKFVKLGVSAVAAALLLSGCATTDTAAPAATAAAPAMTDAQVAAALKGQWTGEWSIGQYAGKFVLIVKDTNGALVTGEGHFYGTAKGDSKEPLATGVVEKGELKAKLPSGMEFKLKMRDDKNLRGSWAGGGFQGDLNAKKN